MILGVVRAEFYMPANGSLKDKRRIVRSLCEVAQHRLKVSVAEVDRLDEWQHAVLGFVCVSNDTAHVHSVISNIVRYLDTTQQLADLTQVDTEVIHAL